MRYTLLIFCFLAGACQENPSSSSPTVPETEKIEPVLITEAVPSDSDDPAIWVHPKDPSRSLILGNDKVERGGIYAFDLQGKLLANHKLTPVARPNNIDLEYGFVWKDSTTAIAVFTERLTSSIRVVTVPQLEYIDGGGIQVFVGEKQGEYRAPMGISIYKAPEKDQLYAIVSRKTGPTDSTYLWQYALHNLGDSVVAGKVVRKFGAFSGQGEIEAIAVDDEMGFVYYSDEGHGIRKYWAHPDSSSRELACFGKGNAFREDREGIAIWKTGPETGYLIVSDQQAHRFNLFPRKGGGEDGHEHPLLGRWNLSTIETDGCAVVTDSLSPRFPNGVFVAMSEGGVFHYYDPGQLIRPELMD